MQMQSGKSSRAGDRSIIRIKQKAEGVGFQALVGRKRTKPLQSCIITEPDIGERPNRQWALRWSRDRLTEADCAVGLVESVTVAVTGGSTLRAHRRIR